MFKILAAGHDQTTDFTCGAACLLTIMDILGLEPGHPAEELLIWREANSIFMGEGHAGIGPYALANAAARRGMKAAIWTDTYARQFSKSLRDNERRAYEIIEEYDREESLGLGVIIKTADFSVKDALNHAHEKRPAVILVSPEDEDHWVVSYRLANGDIFYFDPYYKHIGKFITEKDFDRAYPAATIKAAVFLTERRNGPVNQLLNW